MARIRVLIAEADAALRWSLADRLAREPDMEVVDSVGEGRDAVARTNALRPDVLRLQLELPDISGLEVLHQLVQRKLPTRVLVVAADDSDGMMVRVLSAGARGFLKRGPATQHLAEGIRAVASDQIWVNRRVIHDLEEELATLRRKIREREPLLGLLSDLEKEVLILAARGRKNAEIARRLAMAPSTVAHHLTHIYDKLGVNSRIEAAAFAVRSGLVDENESES
jgi:DNA-binding NarL/FixJ family response regulator